MTTRKIILIDEEKCTGCGQCIIDCAEGALEIVDGKAKLVGDIYCDGLGACIGNCPEGALTIIERDAVDFDEEVAIARVRELKEQEEKKAEKPLACGCPGSAATTLKKEAPCNSSQPTDNIESGLGHWPIKLQLLGPGAPFLDGAELLLLADCAGASYPELHRKMLPGKAVAMGCPKLDDLEAHIERLAEIVKGSSLKSITVVRMEVPCCRGFVHAAEQAVSRAGVELPLYETVISRTGQVLSEEKIA